MIDLSGIEDEALKLVATLVGLGMIWVLQRAIALVGLRLSAERQAALGSAIDKMLTFGVTQAEGTIAANGWNHIATKNAVIAVALQALPEKFPDALAGAGLDLTLPADHNKIVDQMTRMIPEVFARAAASPATPPAPQLPIVIIPPLPAPA